MQYRNQTIWNFVHNIFTFRNIECLTFDGISIAKFNNYFCMLESKSFCFTQIVINPVSQQCICSFQCKLTVHPRQKQSPPYFVEKLSPAKVDMRGENVSLYVKATGKPMPNLTWLKVRFEMHAYHYLLLYFPTCIFNYFSILFYKRLIK